MNLEEFGEVLEGADPVDSAAGCERLSGEGGDGRAIRVLHVPGIDVPAPEHEKCLGLVTKQVALVLEHLVALQLVGDGGEEATHGSR